MNTDAINAGKFYLHFKLHKPHENIPPERAIVSQSGSVTSNIGVFVDFFLKEQPTKHKSYLQDNPDFIRKLEKIREERTLSDNAMIATWDQKSSSQLSLRKKE